VNRLLFKVEFGTYTLNSKGAYLTGQVISKSEKPISETYRAVYLIQAITWSDVVALMIPQCPDLEPSRIKWSRLFTRPANLDSHLVLPKLSGSRFRVQARPGATECVYEIAFKVYGLDFPSPHLDMPGLGQGFKDCNIDTSCLGFFNPERWTPGPELDHIRIPLIWRSHRFDGPRNVFKISRARASLNLLNLHHIKDRA
jgi:hypothetical protein